MRDKLGFFLTFYPSRGVVFKRTAPYFFDTAPLRGFLVFVVPTT